ncbi:GRF-type domain-containing protein [Abeliophyllum distichum]|uniref:GRF-type domain-containing protein n=1 Tax=Abeliophyllum distichum TaxID=126358 RepID=A0ABD1V9D8_9LAMI
MVTEYVDGNAQITERTLCMCGRSTTMRTAWKENNPSRRFLGCSFYRRPNACDYFKWVDPLVQTRYKNIINGLLRNANHKDELVNKLHIKLIYHQIVLAMVVMVVLVHCVL